MKIELLAPAGDLERLKIAYLYGADACYIGGKDFSLRANANNFSISDMEDACNFAHSLGKKLYVTVNIVFHNEDLDGLLEYLKDLERIGIDAIIVSDPVVIDIIKKNNINLEVHFSTQGSTTNSLSVKYWMDKGCKRVVLAREVSGFDISNIIKDTGCDIEVFLHGAMCTCISGRCVLSNYFTNRDSNRGGCAQVCRFVFDLDKERATKFSIATKDLNMAREIKSLIDMGVCSLKIEGRMRSIYYVATVINCYRRLIDSYYNGTFNKKLEESILKTLDRVANRESSVQFFKGYVDVNDQYYIGREEVSNQDFLAIVTGYDYDNKMLILEERNFFKVGDKVDIFTPDGELISFNIESIYNNDFISVDAARHPKEVIKIPFDRELPINSMMRINL